MVSALIVGINTYRSLAEATEYLSDSIRAAAAWEAIDSDNQTRALISAFRLLEKQCWNGTIANNDIVTAASITAGGTGYAVNDVLTVVGGTFGHAATLKVTTVASGVVTGVQLLDAGLYQDNPTSPAATTVAPAGGTGCTLTLTFEAQTAAFPRDNLYDHEGNLLSSTAVPQDVGDAQIELAYELAISSELEAAGSTASNLKRAKAGSAEVEFFGGKLAPPTYRFPPVVWEYIAQFACGFGGATRVIATGTCGESQFDDADFSDLTGPI